MPAAIWPISSKMVYCCGAEGGTNDLLWAKVTDRDTRPIIKIYTILQLT